MTKRDSLRYLLQYSDLFVGEAKENLLRQVDFMSDEDVQSLGQLLAVEKEMALIGYQQELERANKLIADFEATHAVAA